MKYIIAILWFGVMFPGILNAQKSRSEKRKDRSTLAAPAPGDQNITRVDTVKGTATFLPFGQFSSKNVVSDVSIISPDKELGYDNSSSVSEALSGRVPGIYSGTNLRGLGNALIVIDGIPGSLSSLNLTEVEQITVLKDANSAMLYGVQANNGVILITTKRGKANQNKINAIAESGFALPISYPKYLGSAEYMGLYNEALSNDGLTPRYTQIEIDATKSGTNPIRYPDANYFTSSFLKKYKPYSRIVTDFSGGNKSAQYYANLGWQRSGSLLEMGQSHTDRLNLRSNLNVKINDFISGHVDIVTIFNIANVTNGNFFSDVTSLKPNYYPPLIDASLIADKAIINTAKYVNGKYLLGGTSLYRNNVYGNALMSGYSRQINTTGLFNLGLDFDLKFILKGLTFKTLGSFNFYNQFDETQTNTYAIYEPKWLPGKSLQDSLAFTKIGVDQKTGTQGISNTSLSRDYTFYGVLDYARVFGKKHDFSASLLGYFDKYNVAGVFQTDKHSHLGSRINYVYDNKYIVNLSGALVSSPKLSPDNRLGFSPSAAVGWVISEDLFKGNPVINYLKLSASGGIINTDMSLSKYYSYEDIWSASSNFTWSETTRSQAATALTNVSNDKLFYEKRKELNLGIEAILFNNALQIDGNVFVERKSDQIVIAGLGNTYPAFLGSLNPAENYNEDQNRGIELGATWRKSYNKFSFELGTSMLFLDTKVLKRDEFYGWDYLYRTGRSTGAIFGLEAQGFFKDDADIANHANQLFGTVKPGDIKYKDQNGDKIIDTNDEIQIGNSNSKIVGGLSLKLKYGNFTLFSLATARQGGQRFFNNSYYWVNGDVKYSEVVRNRWTPATAETATYPRLSSNSNANNFRTSTFWIEDNSLISLERVQLSYDLSNRMAKKLLTKNLSLYVRGSNLMNFAGNKDKMELSIGSEPQYRNYSVGLKALF